eukprot:Gb_37712 [translate_table: standard]
MESPLYSFEGSMELHECFLRLEEYFNYARFQHEWDKTFTTMLHLTGQAYTWVTQICEVRGTNFPWNTLEELKEELKLMQRWKSFQEKHYNNIKEEDPSNEETDKESNEDNNEDFDSDNYEYYHEEEDCTQEKQIDNGYKEDPNEHSDEECDLEYEDNEPKYQRGL